MQLKGMLKNVSLSEYTTFKIGGKADYFFSAQKKDDIIKAAISAKKEKLPFFVFGGGSNLLVSDKGFRGLVIQNKISNIKNQKYKSKVKITAGAGVPLGKIISETLAAGAKGFEWASGIPGTVGGAVFGNAGAFGGNTSDHIDWVEVLDTGNYRIEKIKKRDCGFGYRESIFKKNKNLVILSVQFVFKNKEKKGRNEKEKSAEKIKEIIKQKKKNQPLSFPSAGSVFKNPPKNKLTAGQMIELCGLGGKKAGGAQISSHHANFIVNLGGAKASDVTKLINLAKKCVKGKFGIDLEEETRRVGF